MTIKMIIFKFTFCIIFLTHCFSFCEWGIIIDTFLINFLYFGSIYGVVFMALYFLYIYTLNRTFIKEYPHKPSYDDLKKFIRYH